MQPTDSVTVATRERAVVVGNVTRARWLLTTPQRSEAGFSPWIGGLEVLRVGPEPLTAAVVVAPAVWGRCVGGGVVVVPPARRVTPSQRTPSRLLSAGLFALLGPKIAT